MLEQGHEVESAHCNFQLRGDESQRDESFVRQLCADLGVPFHLQRFDTRAEASATGESIEMAARRLRYAWFEKLRKERGLDAVAVAHHRDDNAETLLLNLLRGSGLRGLCAMAPEVECGEGGCRIVRPLLQMTRAEILAYLEEKGQAYVVDSTNADTKYRRNFVRHRLLPLLAELNPSISQTLNETAERLREASSLVNYAVGCLREEVLSPRSDGGVRIDKSALALVPAPGTLLHEWLRGYGFRRQDVETLLVARVGAVVEASSYMATVSAEAIEVASFPQPILAPIPLPATGSFSLPSGRTFRVECISLPVGADVRQYISKSPKSATLDADRLVGSLTLLTPPEGQRFTPFGLQGTQTVTRYLTNRHRSRIDKLAALIVQDTLGVVWLVGERVDARAAVNKQTKRVVRITVEEGRIGADGCE